MLKIATLLCILCTGAGATVMLVRQDSPSTELLAATHSESFQTVHANAHLDNLPVTPAD